MMNFQTVGTGVPIIFIHGFSLDSRMWQPQVNYFTKTNQVITYDMRGFGKSEPPSGSYSHVEDLRELLASLKVAKAHIVGLSLGGEVAIDYTLTYPDTVLSLTLADTSLGGYASTVDWRVYAKEQGLEHAKQNWLNHAVFVPSSRNPEVAKQLKDMVDDYSGWHWLNEDQRIKLDPPAKVRLSEINVSTQIILGELDLPYYHDIAMILTDKIPNSKLHIIKDAGHMTNLEKAQEFNFILGNIVRNNNF